MISYHSFQNVFNHYSSLGTLLILLRIKITQSYEKQLHHQGVNIIIIFRMIRQLTINFVWLKQERSINHKKEKEKLPTWVTKTVFGADTFSWGCPDPNPVEISVLASGKQQRNSSWTVKIVSTIISFKRRRRNEIIRLIWLLCPIIYILHLCFAVSNFKD